MIIWGIKKLLSSSRGSVLMEFILVLPIYIAVMGGILWIGLRSLDAINLRSADQWGAWSAGNRFYMRLPAIVSLREMFPRSSLITTNTARRLESEYGYLQFIGSKTTLFQNRPDYISNWINMPLTMTGEKSWDWSEYLITSSRFKNPYTQCIIMRSKGSKTAKRHWDSSLIADKEIWKFDNNDTKYPNKWNLSLFDNIRYNDDTKEYGKEPKKINFYTRYDTYEKWSEKN